MFNFYFFIMIFFYDLFLTHGLTNIQGVNKLNDLLKKNSSTTVYFSYKKKDYHDDYIKTK